MGHRLAGGGLKFGASFRSLSWSPDALHAQLAGLETDDLLAASAHYYP